MSAVSDRLMEEEGYTPYCGNVNCVTIPRTEFNGKQFVCPSCKWESKFTDDFIKAYKDKWGQKLMYRAFRVKDRVLFHDGNQCEIRGILRFIDVREHTLFLRIELDKDLTHMGRDGFFLTTIRKPEIYYKIEEREREVERILANRISKFSLAEFADKYSVDVALPSTGTYSVELSADDTCSDFVHVSFDKMPKLVEAKE